jgi:lysophospholipase L1-like esterase
LRGPETTIAKPAGVKRVLFIGDSVTEGSDVSDDDIFPRVVEQIMNRPEGGTRIEVLNGAAGGYNTYAEKWWLYRYGLRFDPDVVVVGFCFNDVRDIYRGLTDRDLLILDWDLPREAFPADSDFAVTTARLAQLRENREQTMAPDPAEEVGRLGFFMPASVQSFLQEYSGLYGFISRTTYFGRRPRFIWERDGPITPHGIVLCDRDSPQLDWLGKQFSDIVDTCLARDIPVLTVIVPRKEQLGFTGQDCAQANLSEVLEEAGSAVLDVLPAIREQWEAGQPPFLSYDPLHLAEPGHRVVAERLAPRVRELLALSGDKHDGSPDTDRRRRPIRSGD